MDQIEHERHGNWERERQRQGLLAIDARQRQSKPGAGYRHDRLGCTVTNEARPNLDS